MNARSHSFSPLRWFLVMALVGLTLLLTRAAAEAATFRTHIARVPDTPTSAETARVWINSDTALGETAGVETQIGGVYTKYLGTFDSGGYPGANWRVDLPAKPNGTTVSYQLFTRNEFSNDYGFTGFNWSYTVDDGDVAWAELKHDTFDSYYRNPFGAVPAGTQVTLRFGTKPLNPSGVDLRVYTYDPATQSTSGPVDYPMTYLEDADGRAIWTYTLTTPGSPAILYYHFVVTDRLDVDYYGDDFVDAHDNLNQGGTGATSDNQGANGFQLTVYDPAFETPQWLQDANVYQIFPDRFRNGDPTNDYCRGGGSTGCPLFYGDQDILLRDPWNTLIGDPRVAGPYFNEYGTQFYGGDLQGLIDKLDYLQAAGFDTIYTTPIFDGSSNHRYDTDDYLSIDPALGTQADFEDLITALDARGMKLIVDGVFNHTSSDSLYFDRYHRYGTNGACESLASPYRGWFEFLNNDIPCGTGDYTGWFGYDSLAVLQDGSAGVRDFIYRDADSVVETWYDRGVSGWRFDVADEISHNWWRDFRPYAKVDAPNGPLVGEVWPDASAFLLGDQLDSVMNYRFRKNVLGFVRQAGFADNDNNGSNVIISLTPSQFDRTLEAVREDYPPQATAAMLNLLDSHDTNRLRYLVDILGESDAQTLQRQELAALFQYTYLGAPMVYYGDEVALDSPSLANGVNGPEDDPYNRAPYPWADEGGDADVYGPADSDMLSFYSLLGNLRQNNAVLRDGNFSTVLTGDTTPNANDNSTYAFARVMGGSVAAVAMNPGTSSNTAVLPLGLTPGTVLEDRLTGTDYTADGSGNITVALPARTGVLLMEPTPTSLTVKKVVVGTPPGSPWEFGGDQGSFTLPAAGGETTFSPLPGGSSQIIAETDRAGWVASVACSPGGETGTAFVAVTLADGEQSTCTFTNTLCQPGHYDNGTSCIEANPGYYVDVPGATSQTECAPGTYQGNYAGVQCDLADPGYYAGGTAAPAQSPCAPGSFQPNSGQESCLPADPGYYVNIEAAQQQSECALGSYQPDSGKTSCLLADPGYYVDATAAIEQTACPSGTTSPQGSDSIDDCVATTATLTILKATDPAGGTDFPFTLNPGAISFVDKWGSNGVGQGQFNGPFGIALDSTGNVYVTDTFNYRVQKFDAAGNFILMWGKDVKSGSPTGYEICLAAETCKAGVSGSGNGEFNIPHGITVDGAGNVYVADKFNNRIQKFNTSGNYLGQWGTGGSGNGQFDRPSGVAADDAGNVFVADTDNNRIQKFTAAGAYLGQWGGLGPGSGQFFNPYGIAAHGGLVYVADTFNYHIQVFDTAGGFLNTWGTNGSGNGQFDNPYHVVVDAAGNVYVGEGLNADRIQKFDRDGAYLGQWGSLGSGNGQFQGPVGVAVAGNGDVYTVENGGHRVQRFSQATVTLDDGQSHAYSNLAPGTYLVSELVPDNWALSNIDCGGADTVVSGNVVSVTLAAGDDVTCTFSNTYTGPPPETGTIVIVKEADPADDTEFDFTEDIVGNRFTLQDPSDNAKTFSDVPVGSYTVTEDGETGWTLDDIDCDDTNSTQSVATKTATINLEIGETVTCTFTNNADTPPTTGSIRVTKEIIGGGTGTFSICVESDCKSFSGGDGEQQTWTDLAPGDYTVSEEDAGTSWNEPGDQEITVTAGQTADVTVTNTYVPPKRNLTLSKTTNEPGYGSVAYFDWPFADLNGGNPGDVSVVVNGSLPVGDIDPGVYDITEIVADGWDLASVTCNSQPMTITNNTVSVDLTTEDMTCVFHNVPEPAGTGTIIIEKLADPDDGHVFAFNDDIENAGGFFLEHAQTREFTNVPAGQYGVLEYEEDGWTLDDVDCDDTDSTGSIATRTATINLSGGETVTCTFSNSRDTGTIVIVKDADPADNTEFSFTENIEDTGFTLKDPADNTETFNNVPTGSYTVSENVPAPWLLDDIDCDDINSIENEAAATATINLEKDETVTCTFSNSNTPPGDTEIYVSTSTASSIAGGPSYGSEDILKWDGSAWSVWFDGSAAGLTAKNAVHNINSFWIDDPTAPNFILSFTQNARFVPGIATKVDGMDLVRWNGSAFSLYFDGQDVGLTNKTAEKIDGLHVLDGSASPIGGGSCLAYLLISTQGVTKVPNYSGGTLNAGGEDVLGFCATALGATTTGLWHMVLDGSAQGMPKNSTDSISVSDDGQTLYLTTKGVFNVDAAAGGHSVVYAYNFTSQTFSGPFFSAAAAGVSAKVDGLQVQGDLP